MKFKINVSSDELAEFLVLMRRSYGADPKEAEDNKYTQAVGKAIAESITVEEKPKRGRRKSKDPDRGRIMALWNGGWKISEIAKDVGCTEQTVRNVIKEDASAGKVK